MTDTTELGPYVMGEIPEPWTHSFLDAAGTPLDLTGHTAKLSYRIAAGDQVVRNATVTDPADGEVTYEWSESDLSSNGVLRGELTVGNGTNRFIRKVVMFVRDPSGGTVPDI